MPKPQKTTEQFKEEVFKLVQNEYEVLGEYKHSKEKILIKHNKCGCEWGVTPNNFLSRGSRCSKCYGTHQKTTEQFKKEIANLVNNEYIVLGEYKSNHTKILLKHTICGQEFKTEPSSFISQGSRCPKCFGTPKKTTKQFKEEVFKLVQNEYEVLGEYKHNKEKILIRHNKCGCEWNVNPSNFLSRNSRCPMCNESKGERKISQYLKIKGLKYIRQYWFYDCRNKKPLPFDFAIFTKDENLVLIEYDGEHHFKPSRRRNGVEKFKETQYNDRIKTAYCIANNIILIRIPYTEKDIETYLNCKLKYLLE